jgi:hypothetical protein
MTDLSDTITLRFPVVLLVACDNLLGVRVSRASSSTKVCNPIGVRRNPALYIPLKRQFFLSYDVSTT